MNRLTFSLAAVLAAAIAPAALAQWNVARFDAERNRAYTSFGLDPALVTSLGYGRVVPVLDHNFQITADAGVVTARLDTRDFRARVGTQTSLLRWRSMQVAGSATFISRGTSNAIYDAFSFGADLTAAVGVYRPRWFAAVEAGKDKAIMTHITNSDYYRSTFYAGAKDGWYLDSGGTLHHGIAGGVTLGRTELAGRFGWSKTERYNAMLPPIYGTLGLGIGF